MIPRPPISNRSATLVPYTTLCRPQAGSGHIPRLLQDIRRALVAREQFRAVVGRHEGLERLHAGQISDDLIFALFEAENRIDQVVSNTSFALLHLAPVDEKVRDGATQLRPPNLGHPAFVNRTPRALFLLLAFPIPAPGCRLT